MNNITDSEIYIVRLILILILIRMIIIHNILNKNDTMFSLHDHPIFACLMIL